MTLSTRRSLAEKAFTHGGVRRAHRGVFILVWRGVGGRRGRPSAGRGGARAELPALQDALARAENPHQTGAFYRERSAPLGSLARAESLGAGGKELSFNNLIDVDAALEAVLEHEESTAVIVKHTNPCGVAVARELVTAYRVARKADPVSAFGGIVALNREVDQATAEALAETFIECVIAPGYAPDALSLLRRKQKLRVLATNDRQARGRELVYKCVSGGLVVQDRDTTAAAEVQSARIATKRAPTAEEIQALEFAWRVCKHVKSNAIVLARLDPSRRTVGIGAGQMSRVESVKIACGKASKEARGSVLASDAFFPFPDGVELAIQCGVGAIAHPGGA